MKGLLSISFFLLITVGCFAGKIKGELRTESNGFQWYNYEGKEAYTKEGVRLFPDIKASEIKYILPFNDKESGEGCFVVKLSKKENLYINGISTKGDYYNLYTANGILIKGNMLLFVERFGIGQSTNKTFYTIIATTPLHSASGNQFKPTISIINDNGTSLIYDIDQSNIIALLKDEKDEGLLSFLVLDKGWQNLHYNRFWRKKRMGRELEIIVERKTYICKKREHRQTKNLHIELLLFR